MLLLPQAQSLLRNLPPLHVQASHGDLAAPNLMMRVVGVAAVIDFQPPSPHFLAWEIARIGYDLRTISVRQGLSHRARTPSDAYGQEDPTVPIVLQTFVSAKCADTLAATYPLVHH